MRLRLTSLRLPSQLLLVSLVIAGCSSTYYSFWQKFGYEKRDLLVGRVEDAREAQQDAKEEFKDALTRFQELTNYKGGELEAKYKKLNAAYESAKAQAEEVRERVNGVEKVANDLFAEWQTELGKFDNADLRRQSEQQLRDTKASYQQLITAMRQSEAKMEPVLKVFSDQVLSLKHNLNAQAIASLQGTAATIETDVQRLIKEMEASINEADAFIKQMKK